MLTCVNYLQVLKHSNSIPTHDIVGGVVCRGSKWAGQPHTQRGLAMHSPPTPRVARQEWSLTVAGVVVVAFNKVIAIGTLAGRLIQATKGVREAELVVLDAEHIVTPAGIWSRATLSVVHTTTREHIHTYRSGGASSPPTLQPLPRVHGAP